MHAQPDHTICVLEGGILVVYINGTEKRIMELTDAAVNIGNTTIKILTHDIYRPG